MVRVSFLFMLQLIGCSPSGKSINATEGSGDWEHGVVLPAEPYEAGDADQGWYSLLHDGYMSCGVPWKLWEEDLTRGLAESILIGDAEVVTIEGRTGHNADLPHILTAFTTTEGVDVVSVNCLQCHSGSFNGEMVLGLGSATADFTSEILPAESGATVPTALLESFGLSTAEIAQFEKIAVRGSIILPSTRMRTIGHNPAEMLAVKLMLHHDRDTLAWSDEPLTDGTIVDASGAALEDPIVTSDPPPWWRAHKKNALFYNGMARGDHRGTMMLATSICVDNIEEAERVDRYFVDIQEFIRSLRAPVYPFGVDADLATDGAEVFQEHCAGCHGTYGATDAEETYPNLLIPLEIVGTDPVVANAGVIHAPELVEWYNESFYGGITRFEPVDLESGVVGYMPPPLDGIWATAPFLHNGSIPTLAQLLDSSTRPDVWRRVDYDSTNFDEDTLGWPHEVPDYSQAEAPADEQVHLYDTSYWSQSNAGHTYGDALTEPEREALIEYLKTL
jgi:mono/diheme cytochrome c family protein